MILSALSPLASWLVWISLFAVPGAVALYLSRPRAPETEFPRDLTDAERAELERELAPCRVIPARPYDWRDEL